MQETHQHVKQDCRSTDCQNRPTTVLDRDGLKNLIVRTLAQSPETAAGTRSDLGRRGAGPQDLPAQQQPEPSGIAGGGGVAGRACREAVRQRLGGVT
jgi:hypothetical protein